jgi:hypothetical protein
MCKIDGEWTGFLFFDEAKYWQVTDYSPLPMYKQNSYLLPSDSTNREDLRSWINNDETNAQTYKEKYEEIQRTDRKLRSENYKPEDDE